MMMFNERSKTEDMTKPHVTKQKIDEKEKLKINKIYN